MKKLQPPRIKYLGKITGLDIYVVSGVKVRNETDIDFTCGGNEAVYPSYVPPNEIWIDDVLRPLDATATALHEIVERDQMMRFGKDYDAAHEVASAHERPFRQQMLRDRLTKFDAPRVAAAFRAYKKKPEKYPVLDRPNDPPRSRQQIEQDIAEAMGRR